MSPTQRTLAECRSRGWLADTAEYWQPSAAARQIVDATMSGQKLSLAHAAARYKRYGPGVRRDLFGWVDIVALTPSGILGIQATTGNNVSHRMAKLRQEREEAITAWLAAGGLAEIWGWTKYAKPIGRKYWRPRIVPIAATDFARH